MTTTPGSRAALDAGCTCQRFATTDEEDAIRALFPNLSAKPLLCLTIMPDCPIHAPQRPDAGQEISDGE